MAIVDGYVTLEELKGRLDITGEDARLTTILEQVIEAASRQIDGWCNRRFLPTAETRVLTAQLPHTLQLPDDLVDLVALRTDDDGSRTYPVTWDATDYALAPEPGPPWRLVYATGWHRFPAMRLGVQIAGTWGASEAVPHAIREATLLQAARLYKRKDAPFGVAGSIEHGQIQTITRIDPDVRQLIAPFRHQRRVGV